MAIIHPTIEVDSAVYVVMLTLYAYQYIVYSVKEWSRVVNAGGISDHQTHILSVSLIMGWHMLTYCQ